MNRERARQIHNAALDRLRSLYRDPGRQSGGGTTGDKSVEIEASVEVQPKVQPKAQPKARLKARPESFGTLQPDPDESLRNCQTWHWTPRRRRLTKTRGAVGSGITGRAALAGKRPL